MNIRTPEYAKQVLMGFFKEDEVEIRDYNKVCDGKYKERGISVLAYSDPWGAWINFKPNNTIEFIIELDSNGILQSNWKIDDVDDSVYEYYMFIINMRRNFAKEFGSHISKFSSQDWIERHKKLSQCLN